MGLDRIRGMESLDLNQLRLPYIKDWTAIIPAAGRGTRLGQSRPKILFPILGKPILDWLVGSLGPFAGRFVFVLAPESRPEVEPLLEKSLKDRYDIAIQKDPAGMADAVWQAKPWVRTAQSMVVWGDQVGLTRNTIAACLHLHASRPDAALTFPTVWRQHPYIHFERDAEGRLTQVYQARESAHALAEGENDCGIFFFRSRNLFDIIEAARAAAASIGEKTGEFNLLPLLPQFEQAGSVMTLRIPGLEESLGVNTPDDARRIEDILKRRR